MKYRIILHEDAHQEYIDAYLWYEQSQPGLGERFIQYVDESLGYIAANPLHFQKRKNNLREARLPVFPYNIVFEVLPDGRIIVTHIYHSKRDPKKKYKKRK